jgi:hypothetical protein
MPRLDDPNNEAERLLYRYAALACIDSWCRDFGSDEELTIPLKAFVLEECDTALSWLGNDAPGAKAARFGVEALLPTHLGRKVGDLQREAQDEMTRLFQELEKLFDAAFARDEAEEPLTECYSSFRAIRDAPVPAPHLHQRRKRILIERTLEVIARIHDSRCFGAESGQRDQAESSPGREHESAIVAGASNEQPDEPYPADQTDMWILEALERERRVAKLDEIRIRLKDQSGELFSTKTIGGRLKQLEGAGFVEWPRGKKRGVRITSKGRDFLRRQKQTPDRACL